MNDDLEKLIDRKMAPLMEMQQQLIDQNIRLSAQLAEAMARPSQAPTPTPANTPTNRTRARAPKTRGIVIGKIDDGSLSLTGNTFDIKDTIKSLGGSWNPAHCSWILDGNQHSPKAVQTALQDAGAEQVSISCASW